MLIHFLGALGATISFIVFLPQALKTWRDRNSKSHLAGVSLGTQLLILCNASVWGLYAVLTHAWWSGAPGLFNAPLAIFVCILLLRGRRLAPDSKLSKGQSSGMLSVTNE